MKWILSGFVGFVVALGAAAFLMLAPRTIAAGLTSPVYYLILVVLGCAAALLLFGAMRGYARYKGKVLRGSLELGGPVVAVALVVVGGYIFSPERAANIVVVATDTQGNRVCPGSVQIELGQDWREGTLGNCQAQFNEVPAQFLAGQGLTVTVKAVGYRTKTAGPYQLSVDRVIQVPMVKEETMTSGHIEYPDKSPVSGASLLANGVPIGTTDFQGNFRFEAPYSPGQTIQLTAIQNDNRVFDAAVTIPVNATLTAMNPARRE